MKHLVTLALFVALVASAPTSSDTASKEDNKLVTNEAASKEDNKLVTNEAASKEDNKLVTNETASKEDNKLVTNEAASKEDNKLVTNETASKEDNKLVTNEAASKENDKLVITEGFFLNDFKIFTAEHDIINLLYPLNNLNFDDDADDGGDEDQKTIFFVEADLTNGVEYKGLSVYKNNVTTKILPTGTTAAADAGDSKIVYFGATDGLYIYNEKANTAQKFGPITDSIIDIAKANGTDLIYILTDKNEIFKVSENGTKKEKVDIAGVKQIVLDYSNNLYYYAEDKTPYVVTKDGVKKIEGLPSDPNYIKFLRPAFVMDDAVPIVLDNKAYTVYANGSSEYNDIDFNVKPSAYALDATLIQYYAYNKSIYEYNIAMLILSDIVEDLKTFFEGKEDEIEALATRSISGFDP